MMVKQRVGVGAYCIKSDVAKIEQAGQTNDDIEPQTQHNVHQRGGHDVGLVGGKDKRKGYCKDEQDT